MNMPLHHAQQLSDDIYSFSFQPERRLDHTAGQFAEFTLPSATDPKGPRRWFTLSSSPTESLVTITVRMRQPLSGFKQALAALQPGDSIQASDPLGDFVLPLDESRPLIWIAAGIGITPFRSMAQWIADKSELREIQLFHAIKQADDTIFEDIFTKAGIQRHSIDTAPERPDPVPMLASLPRASESLIYLSGPEIMVGDMQQSLLKAGFDRECIIIDQFLGYDI